MGSFDSWIEWFLAQRGNNFLCEVDASFVQDSFNLYGLQAQFEDFSDTVDLILSAPPRSDRDGLAHPLYADARVLYGLIHARFILTSKGLTLMVSSGLRSRAPRRAGARPPFPVPRPHPSLTPARSPSPRPPRIYLSTHPSPRRAAPGV